MTWRLVTTDFPPQDGGIATWAAATAWALHRAGEPVVVHARARSGVDPSAWPFPVIPMPGRSWRRWQGAWAAASVLPRLRRGDRLLVATWPLAVGLLDGARLLGVPVGVTFHGSDLTRPPPGPGRERVIAGATARLPVSDFLGAALGAPYTRLPMPIDPLPPVARGDTLLTVARLVPGKGVDRVLALGRRLGRPVVVVGEGPERARLETHAAALGVRATFTGRRAPADIPWAGAWAVALLSEAPEGLGLVLLEAAARGLPTLGARAGGIPEAAWATVEDPAADPLPPWPDAAALHAWLRARHGTGALVATLRATLA